MAGGTINQDNWTLRPAVDADVEALMEWFPDYDDVNIWGGPSFRYPFTRNSFFEDIQWQRVESFSLFDAGGVLAGFGQLYERDQRVRLARLVVDPTLRTKGIGSRLVDMLMAAGRKLYPHNEFSLFVYRDNEPAYRCYRALGFKVADYPPDMPHADVCDYLTRSV